MKVHFSAQHPTFGTKHKPKSPTYQQRSPYYWWWAFLRLNEDYIQCCELSGKGKLAQLYNDFGDVRSDSFKQWWNERGVALFAEKPLPQSLTKLTNKIEWDETWGDSVMVVAVPMSMDKRYIYSRFIELVKKNHTAERGRTAAQWAKSTAKYPINRNHTIDNLRTTFTVYEAYVANSQLSKADKLTVWELGDKLRLVKNATVAKSELIGRTEIERRNILAASVSRYVKQAKQIIAATAGGKFPA
jgi:hypothetical protein